MAALASQTPVKRAAELRSDGCTPEKFLRRDGEPSNFEKVQEFHVAFGVPDEDTAFTDVFTSNPQLVALRRALVDEEFKELQVAAQNSDLHEVVDALADLLYVIYGAGLSFGVDLDKRFVARSRSTTANKFAWSLPTSAAAGKGADECKAATTSAGVPSSLTISNYERVRSFCALRGLLTKGQPRVAIFKDAELVEALLTFVADAVSAFHAALAEADFEATVEVLGLLLFRVYVVGVHLDVDMDKAFAIVHRSNMSKLCKTEEVAKASVAKYSAQWAAGTGKYDVTAYRRSEDGVHWVVYHATSSKVLKSHLWCEPDFAPLGVPRRSTVESAATTAGINLAFRAMLMEG